MMGTYKKVYFSERRAPLSSDFKLLTDFRRMRRITRQRRQRRSRTVMKSMRTIFTLYPVAGTESQIGEQVLISYIVYILSQVITSIHFRFQVYPIVIQIGMQIDPSPREIDKKYLSSMSEVIKSFTPLLLVIDSMLPVQISNILSKHVKTMRMSNPNELESPAIVEELKGYTDIIVVSNSQLVTRTLSIIVDSETQNYKEIKKIILRIKSEENEKDFQVHHLIGKCLKRSNELINEVKEYLGEVRRVIGMTYLCTAQTCRNYYLSILECLLCKNKDESLSDFSAFWSECMRNEYMCKTIAKQFSACSWNSYPSKTDEQNFKQNREIVNRFLASFYSFQSLAYIRILIADFYRLIQSKSKSSKREQKQSKTFYCQYKLSELQYKDLTIWSESSNSTKLGKKYLTFRTFLKAYLLDHEKGEQLIKKVCCQEINDAVFSIQVNSSSKSEHGYYICEDDKAAYFNLLNIFEIESVSQVVEGGSRDKPILHIKLKFEPVSEIKLRNSQLSKQERKLLVFADYTLGIFTKFTSLTDVYLERFQISRAIEAAHKERDVPEEVKVKKMLQFLNTQRREVIAKERQLNDDHIALKSYKSAMEKLQKNVSICTFLPIRIERMKAQVSLKKIQKNDLRKSNRMKISTEEERMSILSLIKDNLGDEEIKIKCQFWLVHLSEVQYDEEDIQNCEELLAKLEHSPQSIGLIYRNMQDYVDVLFSLIRIYTEKKQPEQGKRHLKKLLQVFVITQEGYSLLYVLLKMYESLYFPNRREAALMKALSVLKSKKLQKSCLYRGLLRLQVNFTEGQFHVLLGQSTQSSQLSFVKSHIESLTDEQM